MTVTRCLAVVGLLLAGVMPAAAQSVVNLEFKDGRVKLVTENAPVSVILAEWARRGRTTIVNGERIPGAPATLQLVDVPEREALDIILRGASGYMVAERDTPVNGASAIDRILILPTSRVTTASSPLPSPAAQAAQAVQAIVEDDDDGPPPFVTGQRPQPQLPPGVRVPQPQGEGGNRLPPPSVPGANAPIDRGINEEDQRPPAPTPNNPFGVNPGSSQPGVINPTPQRLQR
ncbi:MAG TPA: hypothetical protein VH436_00290 [Vicinamibacterales bacterium]|jgi:hypothetical protein